MHQIAPFFLNFPGEHTPLNKAQCIPRANAKNSKKASWAHPYQNPAYAYAYTQYIYNSYMRT